jgi:redox-sensing transcriptional repressor
MSVGKRKSESVDPRGVPKGVVTRLSLYLREIRHLLHAGHATTSSSQLGQHLGFSDAQVRKDLADFGHFGQPGVGYRCDELVQAIRGILGTDRQWTVAMVGVGNLGQALLGYKGFASQGFRIVAAFDVDPSIVGQSIEGVPVYGFDRLESVVREQSIELGLVAVPASAAQQVATRLVEAGVAGILNFAPVTLNLPNEVSLVGVDLATELQQLCFSVASRRRASLGESGESAGEPSTRMGPEAIG